MEVRLKNMTEGRPMRMLLAFALPLMLGNIFQQFYVIVDTMVVGQVLGVQALASIGAADWTNWMVLGLATGFTQGFAIPIAQRFGAEDYEGLRKSFAAFIVMSGGIAVVVLIVSQLGVVPILRLLGTPAEVMDGAVTYLRITFAGVPVLITYNVMASVLRALGNSKSPLIAMVIAAGVNVTLDLLFVMGFGWGIAGAAAATVIAQGCSCVYCYLVMRRIGVLHLERKDFRVDPRLCLTLFRLGFPIALQNIIIAVGGMVVQSVVNGYGYLFIAGFTATNKLYGVLEIAATSYGFSMTTYTGQNLGAGKVGRIRQGMRAAFIIAAVTSFLITVCMLLFGRALVGMFLSGSKQEVETALSVAYRYLVVMSIPLFILYLLHIYRSALMGLGDTVVPMLSGVIEFLMRVAAAMTLPAFLGEWGIYLAEPAAWTGAAVILVVTYYVRMKKLYAKYNRKQELLRNSTAEGGNR